MTDEEVLLAAATESPLDRLPHSALAVYYEDCGEVVRSAFHRILAAPEDIPAVTAAVRSVPEARAEELAKLLDEAGEALTKHFVTGFDKADSRFRRTLSSRIHHVRYAAGLAWGYALEVWRRDSGKAELEYLRSLPPANTDTNS